MTRLQYKNHCNTSNLGLRVRSAIDDSCWIHMAIFLSLDWRREGQKTDTAQYKGEMRRGRCLRWTGCHKVREDRSLEAEGGGDSVIMTTTNIKIILGVRLIETWNVTLRKRRMELFGMRWARRKIIIIIITTENSHIGHCKHTSGSTNVKVQ